MNNFGSMMNQFRRFMSNPGQYMTQKMGIPERFKNDPNGAIQYLMNSGRISQADYNNANMMAHDFQNQPEFKKTFK